MLLNSDKLPGPAVNAAASGVVRTTIIILAAIWVGLLAYNILGQISGMLTVHDYRPNFFGRLTYMTLKIWVPWVLLSPVVVWLARRFPVRPDNWVVQIIMHLFLLLMLSLIAGSALSFHYHFREEMSEIMKTYLPWQHIGHFLFGDSLFLYNAIIYTVFVATLNIKNFHDLARKRELDSLKLTNQLNEARLRALKMQVNPHFLFNTLNAVSVLIMKSDNERAGNMIQKLGAFFRKTLESGDTYWVNLASELETVSEYLDIEQVRFEDRLQIVKSYDPRAMAVRVPSMILQPLIENAIKHGLEQQEGTCQLEVVTQRQDERVVITIQDNGPGPGATRPSGTGIGLQNVKERLAHAYADEFTFTLTPASGGGALVTLIIPIHAG